MGHPFSTGLCFGFQFLFLVFDDVAVDGFGELEVAVEVAAVGILWLGEDGERLVVLPLDDTFAAGWAVVAVFNLVEHDVDLIAGDVVLLAEIGDDLLVGEEVAGDHGEDEASVVADVLALFEGVEEMAHHGIFAELFHACGLAGCARFGV